MNKRSKGDYQTITKILETSCSGSIAAAELWEFLRAFHVLSYDFSNSSAKDEAWIKSLLHLLRTLTFAEAIRKASWQANLDSKYSQGHGIVRSSFLNIPWKSGRQKWVRLEGHFSDVGCHFVNSPRSIYTLSCYVQYLYQIGDASLPGALALIAEKFADQLGEAIAADGDLKFHLEALVSRVLFENLFEVRRTQRLRESMMVILDALVQSGSSIAFQLRDDFVTPTAKAQNQGTAQMS